MGIVGELITIARSALMAWHGAPGQAVVVTGSGLGKQGIEAELYQAPGIFGRPAKGTRGVFLPIGAGRRYGVVLAVQNYQVTIDVDEGETTIFSTNAAGTTVKAKVALDNTGKIKISNELQDWKTLLDELIDGIKAIVTVGSATTQTVSPASQATLGATQTKLAQLFKD